MIQVLASLVLTVLVAAAFASNALQVVGAVQPSQPILCVLQAHGV